MSEKRPSENNKKAKRRKKRSGATTPASASGTSTPKPSTSKPEASLKGFDEEDYIAFDFSDPSDDDGETNFQVDAKGKGKARDYEGGPGVSSHGADAEEHGERRRRRDDDYDDRRRRDDSSRSQRREWDKGKRQQRFDPYPSKKAPWVSGIEWDRCKNVAEMLHREVEAFTNWISPSPVEDEIRGMIVTQISKAIQSNFPDAKILPFGSYETKLYLPLGDIDLVILSDSMAWSDKVAVLHALANTLKRGGVTSRVSIIAKAKVPIVKFVTTHGRFNVDISVNQSNGLLAGKIINGFLTSVHPGRSNSIALRSIIMITKAFLAQRSMNEVYTGGLGSYSIVCLAVSFLQMHPKIRSGEIDPEENLGVLVMEFFELYGCYFNYDEVGISLRDGGTYFSKRQRGWYDYSKRSLLSIEDPADTSNDISKGSFHFHKVKTAFAGAHSILTSTAYIRAGVLHSRRSGRSVRLRDHYDPEDLSILSTVMGVTQETINHRRLVQELYDQRTLHRVLGVKPKSVVESPDSSPSAPIKSPGADVAWNEADDSDSDVHNSRLRDDGGHEDEDGRYNIGQPPRKRQKLGTHTVFVADDDDEGDHTSDDEEDDGEYEDALPPSKTKERRSQSAAKSPRDAERIRDYWLSKGLGFGDDGVGSIIMSTTKPAIPGTSLRERIAALEQKNAANGQRSTSPNPNVAPPTAGLRDKISKFEKKGGVPVPRGRFGLGAPPPPEARIGRNAELYGNRIPQPVRMVSGPSSTSTPPSRSGSSIGFYDTNDVEKRRSFSLSSVITDVDDEGDYTPLTSPTLTYAPESLDALEGSPTLSTTSEGAPSGLKEPIKRAAPFSEVLEAAKKAAERGAVPENINDATTPTPFVARAATSPPESPAKAKPALTTVIETPPIPAADTQPEEALPLTAPTIVVESPTISEPPPVTVALAAPADTTEPTVEPEKSKNRNNKDLTLDVEKLEVTTPAQQKTTEPDDNATPTTANPVDALSPPQTGVSSVFSGSSLGSDSLISPRPFSMIDISLAERVTPATSRGNIVFLPPSTATLPRKSDLVYFPPTPTEEGKKADDDDEEPKIVEDAPPVPEQPKSFAPARPVTFSAVVHGKVREKTPAPHPISLVPQTPTNREAKGREDKKKKRMTMIAPPTPATGELASLIQSAVILETMVEKGELPTELEVRERNEAERKHRERQRLAALAAERKAAEEEAKKRNAALEAQLKQQQKEDPPVNKLRHTFLIPLSKARNQHRKEASTSDIDTRANSGETNYGSMRERASHIPNLPDLSEDAPSVPELPSPPHHQSSRAPSIASSKSRFSTFRRLGSVKSVIIGRPSMDTSHSEDSSVDEFGQTKNEREFPSLSPKKSGGIGRATSFAEKMFSRSRTRSGASTNSNASDVSHKAYSMYTLPPLPDSLSVIPPSPEFDVRNPRKSTSMKSLRGLKNPPPPMNLPPVPSIPRVNEPQAHSPDSVFSSPGPLKSPDYYGFGSVLPPPMGEPPASSARITSLDAPVPRPIVESPSTIGAHSPKSTLSSPGTLKSPDYLGYGSMNIPGISDTKDRPTSWMSVSSLSSTLPSPLFENDIFDAFPAVPSGTPSVATSGRAVSGYASFRELGSNTGTNGAAPSFDSGLLNSAIHLAGSSRPSATPKSQATPLPR